MNDHLIISTCADDTVRIYTILTTATVEEARQVHDTWPTATAALGRILTGTLIMGVMSDTLRRLTVQFDGNGPLGKIIAVSNTRGTVKGCLDQPHVDLELNALGKFDVAGAVGSGTLTVIKDYGLKNPYNGIVPIQCGEIGQDFAYYFTNSEQTPSAVGVGVLINPDGRVRVAGGFIAQLLPGYSDQTLHQLEAKLAKIPAVTSLLDHGISPEELARQLALDSGDVKILEQLPVKYQCDCSRDRFRGPLLSLGQEELDDIIKEYGKIEVKCQFCNKTYCFQNTALDD